MKDPCKPSTSVKVLRNAVKIKTGKKTKLTKRNICEVITDIQSGKLPLPPLILTWDRSYLLDKKSPFTSNEYDKLFDKTSSRVVLKRLAEKINIKKVDTLTKSQLIDAILKRLQFLNISEPVKLPAAVSSPTAAPAPKVTVITKPNQVKKSEVIRTTNKGLIEAIPQKTVPRPLRVNSRVPVAPEQGKVILGDRNYDLLFDPKTKKSELIRIAKKVNVENIDKMTRKELIEATTKRLRFMTNRGLTKKAPVPSTPPFFPKVPNRPQPITTPSFLQVKPKAPTPDTGLLNYSRGGANAKGGSFLNFSNGGKKNTNVPNFLKKANVPNAKKGKSFLNFFRGGKKNSNAPSVPKKVNASNAKKGKSFLNFFRGGKKNSNAPTVPKKNTTTVVNEVTDSAVNNMTEELTNNAVISELNINLTKSIVNSTKNNKVANNLKLTKNIVNSTKNNKVANNLNLPKNILNNTKNNISTRINKTTNLKLSKNNKVANNLNLTKNILNNTKNNIGTRINKTTNLKLSKNNKVANNLNLPKNILNNTKNNIGTRINKTKNNFSSQNSKVRNSKLNRSLMNDIINNTRTNIVTRINATPMNTTEIKMNNMTEDLVNNAVNEELTTEIVNEINAGPLTDEIIEDLVSKIINETPVMRLGGRAAEPNQLTNDILTNVEQDVSKEIVTTFNNPLFNNKRTTINNPLFNNKKDGSEELSNYINNLGLQNENKQKLMSLFNTTNQTLEAAKRNATTIRDTRKLEKNANFVSERDKLRNKITKELNMVPNNNGMFSERRGLTKGRIGIWARELKRAKTMENLKNIDNTLAKKTALRRDIENKYTKMGLTKVEKMNHRRKTMKFLNNVDARRELVEIQVKNKTNNNNNTNSVISNYNSNANSNEPKGKMKYGSRENFINAKKIELRELAKNTSTNFGRNINQMETRTNVAKLRGRIEGAVRRNKASFEPVMTNIDRIKRAGAAAEAKRKAKAELRKKNKEVAKATGRGVKATQKKRQMKRK